MKKLLTLLIVPVIACSLNSVAFGADEKPEKKKADPNAERTIRGEAQCAKCSLKEAEECANVIVSTKKGKDGKEEQVVYYLVGKEQHDELFCKGKTEVTAKGTVAKEGKGKDAKMILTATSVEKAKAKKAKAKADASN